MSNDMAFLDLKEDMFPFTFELLDEDREVHYKQLVDGPGVLNIPGRDISGIEGPVYVRVTKEDGTTVVWGPEGQVA